MITMYELSWINLSNQSSNLWNKEIIQSEKMSCILKNFLSHCSLIECSDTTDLSGVRNEERCIKLILGQSTTKCCVPIMMIHWLWIMLLLPSPVLGWVASFLVIRMFMYEFHIILIGLMKLFQQIIDRLDPHNNTISVPKFKKKNLSHNSKFIY